MKLTNAIRSDIVCGLMRHTFTERIDERLAAQREFADRLYDLLIPRELEEKLKSLPVGFCSYMGSVSVPGVPLHHNNPRDEGEHYLYALKNADAGYLVDVLVNRLATVGNLSCGYHPKVGRPSFTACSLTLSESRPGWVHSVSEYVLLEEREREGKDVSWVRPDGESLLAANRAVLDDLTDAFKHARDALATFKSVKDLLTAWPEVEPFVPAPAIPVKPPMVKIDPAMLNARFRLPAQESKVA
ncbi:Nmad5 family putative nucleotide modification protein [Chromobacterium phragmitis]|uniref:Nmad5 family putative nucleotide modification protein n=1 Tax=Chromobacterium phragmitis TaxID=2202141 RepID=A0ABV0J0W9_9NEIS